MARRLKNRSTVTGRGFQPTARVQRTLSPIPYPTINWKSQALQTARMNRIDGRVFRPMQFRQFERPRTIWGLKAPISHSIRINPKRRDYLHVKRTFTIPKSTAVCVRRSMRREVIFATGRGGAKHRRPTRNATSSISCRK